VLASAMKTIFSSPFVFEEQIQTCKGGRLFGLLTCFVTSCHDYEMKHYIPF